MLVLRRRVGEAIVIGDDVELEIIEITRTRVKVGVRAPRTISVQRKEGLRLAGENLAAATLVQSGSNTPDLQNLIGILAGHSSGAD